MSDSEDDPEGIVDDVVHRVFGNDQASRREDLTGTLNMLDHKPESGYTMDEADFYASRRDVQLGQNRAMTILQQEFLDSDMSIDDWITFISNGSLRTVLQSVFQLADNEPFEFYQLCGLCSPDVVNIFVDPKSRLLMLHIAPSGPRQGFSYTMRHLTRIAENCGFPIFLGEMVNLPPIGVDDTYGMYKRLHKHKLDIRMSCMLIVLIGKIFFMKIQEKLPVATTVTALRQVPTDLLQQLNGTVNLHALPHPLRAIIMGTNDWVNFCGLADLPNSSWKGKGSASEAWTKFKDEHKDEAHKAMAYARKCLNEAMEKYLKDLGAASYAGAAAAVAKAVSAQGINPFSKRR